MSTFEKRLIDRVQRYDFLYNKKSKAYTTIKKRDITWLNISRQLDVKVEYCRQRWKSLRDRFLREHRKVQSGQVSGELEYWEHYKQLLFLRDYIRPKKHVRHEEYYNPPAEVKLEESDLIQLETDNSNSKTEGSEFKIDESYILPGPTYSECDNFSIEDISNSAQTLRTKFKSNFEESFVDFVGGMSKLVSKRRNSQPPEETENSLFMKMIVKKLDMLPLSSQGSLQIEILTLVNNETSRCFGKNQI